MGLNAAKAGVVKDKVVQPDIEAGTYPARLVQLIDLGLQPQRPYQGKDKPPINEVMLTYELVDVFMVDEEGNEIEDKPRWVSETLPFHSLVAEKAKSTQRYKSLDPEGVYEGDFTKTIGTPINVTLVCNQKDGKTYTNVVGTSPMRKRDEEKCPQLVNVPKVFTLDDPDMQVFGSLPEWIQEKIKSNLQFNGSKLQQLLGGDPQKQEEKPAKKAKPEAPKEQEPDDVPW